MDILPSDEAVYRRPFLDELITFRLEFQACPACHTDKLSQVNSSSVMVATQNGIFHCTYPVEGSMCHNCGAEIITGAVAFDCLPCEPVVQSGCTWFTNTLISQMRSLRSEVGSSANSLARSIMEHWMTKQSFLYSCDGMRTNSTNGGNHVLPKVTAHWLEKKIAQVLTTGILLQHPTWIDGSVCFRLEDRLSSVCAACHKRCAQVHIDGFFKMRRMKRAMSFRQPKMQYFCRVGKDQVNVFRQLDLENKDEEVDICGDLAGNLTEFRAGDGRWQQKKSVGYSQTGILTGVCPHQVAIAIIPMETKGEKFFLPHAMLDFLEGDNYSGKVDFYSYDVACRLKSYLQTRDPQLHARVDRKLVLGYFHSKSHKCQRWNVGYSKLGSGYNDGEQGERVNRLLLKYTSFLRYMREENMREAMEDFLMSHTSRTNANINLVLHRKLVNTVKHLIEWHERFIKLCMELVDRLSPNGFHLDIQMIEEWVEAYTTRPVADSPAIEVHASKAEQEFVWAHYEWSQLGAEYTEASAALREIIQLGEDINPGLMHKKSYLITVVKAHERMAKKRCVVSAQDILVYEQYVLYHSLT